MSRDKIFRLNWRYGFSDTDGTAAYLEKLHEKGWHLEGTAFGGWHFRRGEGEKVRYAVTYFPEASVYDAKPTDGQMVYADYCAQAGWAFVCAYGPIQYFRSTRPDPVPIETDEGEKLRAIHRTVLKSQGPVWCWMSIATALMVWALLAAFSRRPLELAASSAMLSTSLLVGSFLLYLLWEIGDYLLWYVRSRLSVARGGKCAAGGGRLRACGTWILTTVMLLLLACSIFLSEKRWVLLVRLAVYILLMFGCYRLLLALKGRGYEREGVRSSYLIAAIIAAVLFTVGMNIVDGHAEAWGLVRPGREPAYVWTTPLDYQWKVYLDPLPVTLEDLGVSVAGEDHYSYFAEEDRSLLAAYGSYDQSAWPDADMDGRPGLYCSVTEIPWNWLREWCWKEQIHYYKNFSLEVADDPRWGAVEVRRSRRDTMDRYMLLYGDRIVLVFASNIELTDGQVDILAQRLGLSDWRGQMPAI